MLRALIAVALIAAAPVAAQERELSTDRPDKTESPYTVPADRIQIELDFATYTRDRAADATMQTIGIAPINLKLGLARDTDVQIVVAPYVRQRIAAGTRSDIGGFGDVTIRLKRNLWGNDGGSTAFALMPFVKLPTARDGIGNGRVEGGVIAPLALALPGGLGLGAMTEIDVVRRADDRGYSAAWINSATLSGDLTEALGIYSELFTEIGAEDGSRLIATFDTGLTYAIGEDTQLDLGVNLGLTDAADDVALFAGLSRRF